MKCNPIILYSQFFRIIENNSKGLLANLKFYFCKNTVTLCIKSENIILRNYYLSK